MRYFFLVLVSLASILVLWLNIGLYSQNFTREEKKADLLLQLNFLETELKNNNMGNRMQQLFPEGFVFVNALYGLSWCELAVSDQQNDAVVHDRAVSEAQYAYNEISSARAKRTFDPDATPAYGIFYVGWNNYLLSKLLLTDTTFTGYASCKDTFKAQCEVIKSILQQNENPYLSSYPWQAWPADMFVAMASLANYDKLFGPTYQTEIDTWIKNVKQRLDPATHMIPHKVDPETGNSLEGARGCSASLILRLLAEIDPAFAKEQFKLYRENFVSTTFGLPSINEYPGGRYGSGDVDSGPVIFGVGFSGTIASIGTFSILGWQQQSEKQYKTIHAFGFGSVAGDEKKYLLGALPMADAFISWGRATSLNYPDSSQEDASNWRIKFHVISALVVMGFWVIYFIPNFIRMIKKKRIR